MNKVASFHFELRDKTPLVISYELHNTSFRDKWIDQVLRRNSEPGTYLDLKIANKTIDDLDYLITEINKVITNINSYYDKKLPLFTDKKDLDHDILNYLHGEFEIYGERHNDIIVTEKRHLRYPQDPSVWPGTRFRADFHEQWLKLNELIHVIESAVAVDEGFSGVFTCLVNVYPPEQGEPVVPEDKLFLDTFFPWGQLYLGYNTLGKDYMDIAKDQDLRPILANQVKVQQYYSTEVWLNFTESSGKPKQQVNEFWAWYQEQDKSIQSLIPVQDYAALGLGRYHLGTIMLDETFTSMCADPKEWVNNYDLRHRWNTEVFCQIERAVKIEIRTEEW